MMDLGSLAGLVLVAGTAIVYVGFFLFPSRICAAADVPLKVALMDTYPGRWAISQALVILSNTTSFIGLALVTGWLQGTAAATALSISESVSIFSA